MKASGQGFLPMAGQIDIQIYLRTEPKDDTVVLPDSEMPLLAPKAKKELDAGREALQHKDFVNAQKHLEKANEMAPAHPEVLYLVGSLYLQMNDPSRAEQILVKATQIDPQHAPAQAALGIVLSNQHKCRAALAPLGKALELDPKSWEARWALARCDYSLRSFQPALEESKKALHDSNGLAPDISLVVAASLAAVGQYEESASLLREYLRQNPDRPGATRAKRWLDRLEQAGKIKSN
jgi:tetratricopeptide (TPR) repeat protein